MTVKRCKACTDTLQNIQTGLRNMLHHYYPDSFHNFMMSRPILDHVPTYMDHTVLKMCAWRSLCILYLSTHLCLYTQIHIWFGLHTYLQRFYIVHMCIICTMCLHTHRYLNRKIDSNNLVQLLLYLTDLSQTTRDSLSFLLVDPRE